MTEMISENCAWSLKVSFQRARECPVVNAVVQHSASSSARAPRSAFPPGPHFDPEDPAVQERAFQALIDLEASDDEGDHDRQDGLHAHDFDDDMDMDEDDEDEDEVDEDEFGDPLDLEDPDAEFDGMDPRSAQSEFGGVEMIIPRRSFKGARNIETVKDCELPWKRCSRQRFRAYVFQVILWA
jgi:nuclear receptor interaction protein